MKNFKKLFDEVTNEKKMDEASGGKQIFLSLTFSDIEDAQNFADTYKLSHKKSRFVKEEVASNNVNADIKEILEDLQNDYGMKKLKISISN